MWFDDRLRTVLDQPARDPHDRAVRWRQLVDLLARAGSLKSSPYAHAALDVLRQDGPQLDETLRAAAARAIAGLPLPFELVLLFAADKLKVSAPVLATARLTPEEWSQLLDRSDEETKKFVLALHSDAERRSVPRSEERVVLPSAHPPAPSITEVIARIERVREAREHPEKVQSELSSELTSVSESSPGVFRWECNTGGEFAWVEGAPRGALIGRALVDPAHIRDNGNDEIARAFSLRSPFRNAVMTLGEETLLAGEWQVSGVPAFEPSSGRFAGYRGIARRSTQIAAEGKAPHPDALRELVHEIKTPLNAIMGFAEIIEREMFGPAESSYRDRAAEIVSQSHLLLTAIDDLDFAAKSRTSSASSVVHLGELVERLVPAVRDLGKPRGVEVDGSRTTKDTHAAVDPAVAERLIMRMCGAVIERSESGERLRLLLDRNHDQCRVSITRPAAFWGMSDEDLFGGARGAKAQNFWLRLTRGLAQIAGGDLVTSTETISLVFPRASLGAGESPVYGNRTGQGL